MLKFNFEYINCLGEVSHFGGYAENEEKVREVVIEMCKKEVLKVGDCVIYKDGELYDKFMVCA